ncbi:MAG: beta-hydroxyacyl-ACP dehydratase [Planctomycetaceae bacterium]|nr:beta-hydroxyacyl-ACP dehydratase [Planctomycetaceae bacterium]
MNLDDIKQLIPHREPFLWLDEVILQSNEGLVATKYIDPNLELFKGHYPNVPILPGVIQCEACFQAAAVFMAKQHPPGEGRVPVVTRQNETRFRRIVRPGETITIEIKLTEQLANAFFFTGKVSVEGQVAVRLEFAVADAPLPE